MSGILRRRIANAVLVLFSLLVFVQPPVRSEGSYTVSNTNDSGVGSLRWAMTQAKDDGGPDTIVFDIPVTPGNCPDGVCTINPLTPLPAVADAYTTIDGNTMYQEIKVCHHHPAGEIAYYYKTWPEVYVGEGG